MELVTLARIPVAGTPHAASLSPNVTLLVSGSPVLQLLIVQDCGHRLVSPRGLVQVVIHI